MDNPRKNDFPIILIVIILFMVVLMNLLCSCKTTEREYIEVHDTVMAHHSDTIRDVKVQLVHDSVKTHETHTYTINNVGDTVKEIHHYHEKEKVIVVDSTDRYKAVVDSLRQALQTKEKQKVVKKRPALWEYFAFVGIVLAFAIGILVSRKV